ncbi:MAG TPA: hypothetical protein IAB50_01360 [Candidatus Faecivicinus avistercoris]|nr:hypothetical protein [Candidatus Faecivicinus avistercoris]
MKPYFSDQDIRENKLKAGLGYLVFFLPLVLCKDSKLGRHCANQGLLLLIAAGLVSVLLGIFAGIPLVGFVIRMAIKLVWFAALVIGLLCFLQLTTNDRAVELPYIGSLKILS